MVRHALRHSRIAVLTRHRQRSKITLVRELLPAGAYRPYLRELNGPHGDDRDGRLRAGWSEPRSPGAVGMTAVGLGAVPEE